AGEDARRRERARERAAGWRARPDDHARGAAMNPFVPPTLIAADLWALGPSIALSVGALLLLLLEFLPTRPSSNRGAIVSLLTLVAAVVCVFKAGDAKRSLFEGMFVHDG